MILSKKSHYLQVALNSNLHEARRVISQLPASERILVEAGTPLIKATGADGIARIVRWWQQRLAGTALPYVVADMKTMDRGAREVTIASRAGASGVVALGMAPVETLNAFVAACNKEGVDAMVDMMNVQRPYQILRKMKRLPEVVILHRGVDEERDSDKPVPIHMINKIKGAFDVRVAVAGGDTPREIQSAAFNGADIVVVWKEFYRVSQETSAMAEEFLRTIK